MASNEEADYQNYYWTLTYYKDCNCDRQLRFYVQIFNGQKTVFLLDFSELHFSFGL